MSVYPVVVLPNVRFNEPFVHPRDLHFVMVRRARGPAHTVHYSTIVAVSGAGDQQTHASVIVEHQRQVFTMFTAYRFRLDHHLHVNWHPTVLFHFVSTT